MEEQILILCLLRRHKGKINRKSKTYWYIWNLRWFKLDNTSLFLQLLTSFVSASIALIFEFWLFISCSCLYYFSYFTNLIKSVFMITFLHRWIFILLSFDKMAVLDWLRSMHVFFQWNSRKNWNFPFICAPFFLMETLQMQ